MEKIRFLAIVMGRLTCWLVAAGASSMLLTALLPETLEIYRSMARPDGEYTLVTSIQGTREVTQYEYIDKTPPVEENYFYKIEIPEAKEAFGPLQARPPYSLPST